MTSTSFASRPRVNGAELRHTRGQSVHDLAEIFSPPQIFFRARAHRLRGGWSLDSGALCPLTGQKLNLSNKAEQKEAWNLFKTESKLLVVFPFRLDRWSYSQIDMTGNMCFSQ